MAVTYNSTYMNTGYLSEYAPTASAVRGKDYNLINTLPLEIPSKEISISFGREEDYIELHILTIDNQLLYSEPNFLDYNNENDAQTSGTTLASNIVIDPGNIMYELIFIEIKYLILLIFLLL